MQNLALLLIAAAATSMAAAQSTTPGAATAGPRFANSDDLPESLGYDDAFALYEVRVGGDTRSEDEQVARWQAELAAGRARAGTLVGSYLAYRALLPADCVAARDALTRADELGSDQAPWALAGLAANASCGDPDRVSQEKWLKKAVTLDYLAAAERLIAFYGDRGAPADKVAQYTYARVAGGYVEAVYTKDGATPPRPGYDTAALLEMEKSLSDAERAAASAEAAKILAQMLKRHERFAHVQPVEFSRGDTGGKAAQSFVASTVDYRHECQWNLRANCVGAQRLAFVDLTAKSADFLSCKIELRARDFVTGAVSATPVSREILIGPKATRRLILADVDGQPDKKAITVNCTPVPDLAANAAAGKCRAHLQGTIDVENFYPASAKSRGVEGSAVVRYWVAPGSDVPIDAEIATSSGDLSLDDAAMSTVRSGKFTKDCVYGLSTIRIAFKLQN